MLSLMATRKDIFSEGEFYHLYNRGNSKQEIFLNDEDRDRFLKLLYLCNSDKSINFREDIINKQINAWNYDRGEQLVSIGAWVLMPNHFHIYVTGSQRATLWEAGKNPVSLFMNKLTTAYSMYFNKKYSRTGSLFEGRFKSVHVSGDEQAKYLFSYIHLNPVKLLDKNWKQDGIKNSKKVLVFLDKYKWSSYLDYLGIDREEKKVVNLEDFPDYFSNKKILKEEMFDWLSF